MTESTVLWQEMVPPGASWSHVLKRGTVLRLTDVEGGANVGAIFYNFECPAERYKHAGYFESPTYRPAYQGLCAVFRYGPNFVLRDGGFRGLARSAGRLLQPRVVAGKYGKARYQELRNDCHQNGRDSFLVELDNGGWGRAILLPT